MRQGPWLYYITEELCEDLPSCPVVRTLPSPATGLDLIPGRKINSHKLLHSTAQIPLQKNSTKISNKVEKKTEIMKLLSCRYVHAKDCLLPI